MMTAVLDSSSKEFWLCTSNVVPSETNCFAKIYLDNKTKLYVLKLRYCLQCSKTPAYFCDRDPLGRAWPF